MSSKIIIVISYKRDLLIITYFSKFYENQYRYIFIKLKISDYRHVRKTYCYHDNISSKKVLGHTTSYSIYKIN